MTTKFNDKGFAESDGIVIVYVIDSEREYIGSLTTNVSTGTSLPGDSYLDKPPEAKVGHAILRSEDGKSWIQVADYRGQTIYAIDGSGPRVVTQPGDIIDGYTLLEPSTAYDEWNSKKWVTDTDAEHAAAVTAANAEKKARIDAANDYMNDRQWPGKVALGRLKDEEKAQYILWLDYLDALEAVDTSSAPDINWPTAPEV